MDPLPPVLTAHSPWNEADTPRTRDLKHLRAKRVAYYESIGIIKGDTSRKSSQPLSTASRESKVNPLENQCFGLRMSSRYLATGKKPLLQEESRVAPGEAEQVPDQRSQEKPRRESCLAELDLRLLADASVPETQKLQHVINWAQKFLSKPLEEFGLKCPQASAGSPQSKLCQCSKAQGSKKNAHQRSLHFPPLLKEDQLSTQTDSPSFFLNPPNDFLEKDLSSEFSGSFLKQQFPSNHSCEWQETPVMNDGEGKVTKFPPGSFQQKESNQENYDKSRNSRIQNSSEGKMLPERLRVRPQLRHTSEESEVLEEDRHSSLRKNYFWTPLMDSSEEDSLDEPEEHEGTPRREAVGRNYRGFSGIAFSPISQSALVSQTMVQRGVTQESPVETSKGVTMKLCSRGEDLIQRLPGSRYISPSHNSAGCRKEADNMGFPLRSLLTDTRHKSDWEHALMEQTGEAPLRTGLGGSQNRSVQSSDIGSPPVVMQKQFDLTPPESYLAPQIVNLPLDVSEGPLDNGESSIQSDTTVFCGPAVDTNGARGSTWCEQLPLPEMGGGLVQTSRLIPEETHEETEKTLSSSLPIFRNISKTHLKGSFPPQDVSNSFSWSEEPQSKPEQGASVLEKYFYYVRMLNKIRGLSSEERNFSVPFQGSRMSKSQTVILSPGGHDGSKRSSLDREIKGWRQGSESNATAEDEGAMHPQEVHVDKAAPEEAVQKARFWQLQGNHGRLWSATLKMTSRMSSCGEYREKPNSSCSSHKYGAMKSRFKSLSRPNSAEAEERNSTGIFPSAYALGSTEKFFSKNEPEDEERENKQEKGDADFSQWLLLPDEIWICIFSSLSHKELARVAQVCHHFYRLANDESLWKQVQIVDCYVLEDELLEVLARHQPRSLTLQRCRHASQAVTDRGLKRLFQHCQDVLQELNVISCSGLGLTGDRVLVHAGALCSGLMAVDISWSGATDEGVLALIQGASSLQGLSINGCQITDKAIAALVRKHGQSLQKIEVFGCLALTARSIDSLALQCPHLRTLNIGRVPKVSEACLVRILKNLPEMTAFNVAALKMVKDGIVHLIVTHCSKLESLVLSSCSQVTDVSLVEISTYLKTLRSLDVSGCLQVTDKGIHALTRSCHQLRCLDLSSTGISKRGVCLLANYCHISLECVKLSFCKNVTLDAVKRLCKNCSRLKILHLYGCTITSGLYKIKETYKKVKVFHDMSALTH